MNHFQYKGDELCCEDVPLAKIAASSPRTSLASTAS